MKRFCLCLVALVLLLSVTTAVFAQEVLDLTALGSISITMNHYGVPIPGGQLTMFRVAEVQYVDGAYSYVLTGDFADAAVSLEDIESPDLSDALAAYVEANQIEGDTRDVDENAFVKYENLELGLYLFIQYTPAEGYNATKPFLVSVPMNIDGEYIYDVDGSPKVDPVTENTQTQPETTEPQETQPLGPTLPQTGQLNWPVPVLIVSGLILFVLGWSMRSGKKKEYYEA